MGFSFGVQRLAPERQLDSSRRGQLS